MRSLRIGTRGSRLALAQAGWTRDALSRARPDMEIELLAIRTTGDVILDVPLRPEHGSSFFTKEIEDALLEGRIDVAVHSCKDLATRLPDGLSIAAFPPRVDARDVLVSPHGGLADIPAGSTVGTSSMRRRGFLLEVRPDLEVVPIRGNVPTRIAAADNGRVGAVVLAAAGLIRLGLEDRISSFFPEDHMLPAAGQGALALQVREGDEESSELVRALTTRLLDPPWRRSAPAFVRWRPDVSRRWVRGPESRAGDWFSTRPSSLPTPPFGHERPVRPRPAKRWVSVWRDRSSPSSVSPRCET